MCCFRARAGIGREAIPVDELLADAALTMEPCVQSGAFAFARRHAGGL